MADSESSSNVYTVLVLVAVLALIGAIAVVWMRSRELFGSANPFDVELSSATDLLLRLVC